MPLVGHNDIEAPSTKPLLFKFRAEGSAYAD
jgi:hypothetical protein